MWPAPSTRSRREPAIVACRCRDSAGGVTRSRLPQRISAGTRSAAAASVTSIEREIATSAASVCGRHARSSCMPSATAAREAPAAKRMFFAVTKKSTRRSDSGSEAHSHCADVDTAGSRAHVESSTRPHTSAGRRAASETATAPPSE